MYLTESLLAAILPMLAYLLLIWKMDKFEPEPFSLVLKSFLYGAFGAVILTLAASSLLFEILSLFVPSDYSTDLIKATLGAPLVEEIAKGLYLFALVKNRKFDNLTDGFVYGGAIGLGFGMTENFMYFLSDTNGFAGWVTLVILRTFFSAVMHCISTATFGGFLAVAKFAAPQKKTIIIVSGLATAMLLHFFWNFGVSFNTTAIYTFLLMLVIIIIFIFVFRLSIKQERKMIFSELSEEAAEGLLPSEHPGILSSALRNKKGWIEETIRLKYIKVCTKLAFRKAQYKLSSGSLNMFYEKEVELKRDEVKQLLESQR